MMEISYASISIFARVKEDVNTVGNPRIKLRKPIHLLSPRDAQLHESNMPTGMPKNSNCRLDTMLKRTSNRGKNSKDSSIRYSPVRPQLLITDRVDPPRHAAGGFNEYIETMRRRKHVRFKDRSMAGQHLADKLQDYAHDPNAVVLGFAEVGVRRVCNWVRLDIFLSKNLRLPLNGSGNT